MARAAVLMAAGPDLPKNVAGIVADCGYSAPSAILKSVIRSAHLPVFPVYALLRLGCRLFGGFDPEEASAAGADGALRHARSSSSTARTTASSLRHGAGVLCLLPRRR